MEPSLLPVNSQFAIDISRGTDYLADEPDAETLLSWIQQAMAVLKLENSAVSVRVVGSEEMISLNGHYRGKDKSTNVLSFPSGISDENGRLFLGDIVICNQVVADESAQYDIAFADRFAHMATHGLLHLLGHDHETDADREIMEGLEKAILVELNMGDPYEVSHA